jgi:hypothetical protein
MSDPVLAAAASVRRRSIAFEKDSPVCLLAASLS